MGYFNCTCSEDVISNIGAPIAQKKNKTDIIIIQSEKAVWDDNYRLKFLGRRLWISPNKSISTTKGIHKTVWLMLSSHNRAA